MPDWQLFLISIRQLLQTVKTIDNILPNAWPMALKIKISTYAMLPFVRGTLIVGYFLKANYLFVLPFFVIFIFIAWSTKFDFSQEKKTIFCLTGGTWKRN